MLDILMPIELHRHGVYCYKDLGGNDMVSCSQISLGDFPLTLIILFCYGPDILILIGGFMSEKNAWKGVPSQIENVKSFTIAFLSIGLLYPISKYEDVTTAIPAVMITAMVFSFLFALWDYLVVKNTKYTLTSQRLLTETGVLNKDTDILELYRVKDSRAVKPFFLRLFSLGTIVLITSDKTTPILLIRAIKNSAPLLLKISDLVEACREDKGVREFD